MISSCIESRPQPYLSGMAEVPHLYQLPSKLLPLALLLLSLLLLLATHFIGSFFSLLDYQIKHMKSKSLPGAMLSLKVDQPFGESP